jgi:hypothetical protein
MFKNEAQAKLMRIRRKRVRFCHLYHVNRKSFSSVVPVLLLNLGKIFHRTPLKGDLCCRPLKKLYHCWKTLINGVHVPQDTASQNQLKSHEK